MLCDQYSSYIGAKGRAKYAAHDFQPCDLAILPHYVLIKTAKCLGEHSACCCLAHSSSTAGVCAAQVQSIYSSQ